MNDTSFIANSYSVEGDDEAPFIVYDVATYPSDYNLTSLKELFEKGDIIIPDYQRNYVWSQRQASLLIDSFLSGLPVPPIFLFMGEDQKYLVIDGQQRITSICYYLNGYFGSEHNGNRKVFRLIGLSKSAPWSDKSFKELSQEDQRKLQFSVLRAMIVRQLQPQTDASAAYSIFNRLNTGGTQLSRQEIRNVVFHGPFNDELKRLNDDEAWRQLLKRPEIDRQQRDVEYLLRVFALTYYYKEYSKPVVNFLNNAMSRNRNGQTAEANDFCNKFGDATVIALRAFGEDAFYPRRSLNVASLGSVMSVIIRNLGILDVQSLKDKWKDLQNDEAFQKVITIHTSDEKSVKDCITIVEKYLIGSE